MTNNERPLHLLNYFNGEWQGQNLKTFDVINPATNERIGTMPNGTKEDGRAMKELRRLSKNGKYLRLKTDPFT